MSPSKILFFFCLSFIFGVFLESIYKIPQIFVCGILILAVLIIIIAIFYLKRSDIIYRSGLLFGFCILFLVLGLLRVQISEFYIVNDKLKEFNDTGEVMLTGIIIGEPDIRDASQKLKVKVGNSKILVTTQRYPEYSYLDKIKIIGKLKTPTESEEFSYKNYLMKDGIYSVMGFPKISALGGPASGGEVNIMQKIYAGILFFKQKIRESIRSNFLPPQSLILEGTILGDSGVITEDLKNKLSITGMRHIIAVSGTHVVILSSIVMSLLLAVGLWRGQAFYASIFFICFYVILTGLHPSGVRAGIMGGAYLLSQKIGRQSMSSRIIVLAACLMLLANPMLLFYDVGFQLSFLAVLGLIYLEPIIKMFIKVFTKDKADNLVAIIATTLSAQIFTLPIMIYNFGNVSLVAPITNLLILPVIYWIMGFGFLSAVLGVFSGAIGWILSVPCWFLLTYFLKVIDFFSQPWMAKTINNVSWIWLIILYVIIVIVTVFLRKKYIKKIV